LVTGGTKISVGFINNGTITVGTGLLAFPTPVTNSGTLNIGANRVIVEGVFKETDTAKVKRDR
jgi:hypothetical protein